LKAVIFAGGLGTRIKEESHTKPKPMIEIGGRPIIWHIMKNLYAQGISDFIILGGYKCHVIKEYFANYKIHNSDIVVTPATGRIEFLRADVEDWKVTILDTGASTMTGGRLKRAAKYLSDSFLLTYGDGLCDIDLDALLKTHKSNGLSATVTAVQPSGRFGALKMQGGHVTDFIEKPEGDRSWINGGFFICEPNVFERIDDDTTVWEQKPLISLAHDNDLGSYKHTGFWEPMDTLRDMNNLEAIWNDDRAPWKNW
jgi:glucose-1-phosphate cytidylyltransferase